MRDMRANSSLWGAGYRPGDLEQEMARELGAPRRARRRPSGAPRIGRSDRKG